MIGLGVWGGAAAAAGAGVAAALLGLLLTRRRAGLRPAAAGLALAVGWAVLGADLPALWGLRSLPGRLPVAGLAVALGAAAAAGLRGRLAWWAGAFGTLAAAWLLAGSPPARGEFWRVFFGSAALAWAMRRVGVQAGAGAVAVAGTLLLGLAVAGAGAGVVGVAAVLFGVAVVHARAVEAMPAACLAVAVAAAELGAGRLVRGGVGMADLVCVAAVVAGVVRPGFGAWVRGRLGRRLRGAAEVVAPVLLACLGAGAAWLVARAARG